MASDTPDIDAASLFRVEGLVAVITGGGSGACPALPFPESLFLTAVKSLAL